MNQLNFLQALGWALINSLWQMAILWVIYQLITGIATALKPGKKVILATLFTISGFIWFVFTFFISLFSPNQVTLVEIADRYNLSGSAWLRFTEYLLPAASIVYLLLLVFPLWNFFRNYKYVHLIRSKGIQKIDAGWRIFVKKTALAMGIVRQVQILLSDLVSSPVTIGYLKPVILIPAAIVNHLTPQQVEAIILHELTHIYRNDYLFNFIISFIRTILYFNPFVKLFVKSIEKDREKSCDEMVMQHQYRPGEYASALLRLERNKQYGMTLAAAGKDHDLLHRIEIILGLQHRNEHPFRKFSFAVLTLLGIILFNIVVSLKPQAGDNNYQLALNSSVNPYLFASSNPVFLNNDKSEITNTAGSKIKNTQKINNLISNEESPVEYVFDNTPAPGAYHASYFTPVVPELPATVEKKVKSTVNATRKILEEKEWKEIEKCYADAFNTAEKATLKNEYKKELDTKVDWENLENKLRQSYNQINWNQVNEQLNATLAQITIDSLHQKLNIDLKNLGQLEKWMKENSLTLIPDTEISLTEISNRQNQVKQQLEKVKSARVKKIVRL